MDAIRGLIPQNPIDGELKDELGETIKAVVGTFTLQYAKHYALTLAAVKEEEASAEKPPKVHLLERPKSKEDLKKGWLIKEGAVRKNWKKRYFVVRHDYSVDYFEDDKTFEKGGKPKGTMSLCDYRVEEDPGNNLLKKTRALAEKMGIDVSSLPEPKKYPDHTFEITHSRRRPFFVQCASDEEKKDWMEMFRTCCRYAYGFKDQDRVHKTAFGEAIRETRWDLGRWGWWSWGGSEEQVLSDLISDEIEWKTMGKILSRLTGAWSVRQAARNQALKMIDTMVSAAVKPAWAAIATAAKEARAKLEPLVATMVEPIGKAKKELNERLKSAVMDTVTPLLEEHVNPHVKKIVACVTAPVKDSFSIVSSAWEKKCDEFIKEHGDSDDLIPKMGEFTRWSRWQYNWDARNKLAEMYEPLWLLHEIFTDISPWSLVWNGYDKLYHLTDNATYTFESKLKAIQEKGELKGKAAAEKAKASVLKKFSKDVVTIVIDFFTEIIRAIIMPPFEATVMKACKALLTPLNDAIPDAVKQFIDVIKMFEKFVNSVVNECIAVVLKG